MIPALILWLVRKYCTRAENENTLTKTRSFFSKRIITKTALSIIFLLLGITISAQEQTLDYSIFYKGDTIGKMQLYSTKTNDNIYLKLVSKVRMRRIININVDTEEESEFRNGRLVYSNVYRKVNGRGKAGKQTKADGSIYQTTSGGQTVTLNNREITYNLNLLYCFEPVNIREVYSDNFQQYLAIKKVSEHIYKIELPDGNYNYYSFKKGICYQVEVHHSFYTIYIKLNE